MNNKIRKLAEQAGILIDDYKDDNGTPVELIRHARIDTKEFEKFAELIVRECASILRDSDFRLEAYERGADDNCDVGAMFGAEAIEEHFGIKE